MLFRSDDGWGTKYKPEVGDGTQSNPYQIATAWNLAWLKAIIINSASYNNSDIYYKLTTNITIEDGMDWKPIGPSIPFKANFDGNNNEVVNFQTSNSNSHAGFFGIVEGSTINNFTIKGNISASGTGGSYFGGITGLAINASIKGCDNYVNVTNSGGRSTGGIAGSIQNNTVIENCNNYGLISGNEDVGGITGSYTSYVDGAKINNCNNYNIVKGNHQGIGGILGDSQGASIPLSYCTNEADIDGGTSGRLVGGIVGEGYASAITYCSNSGNITGSSNFVGAILGQNFGGTLSSTNTNTGTANGTDTLIGSGY